MADKRIGYANLLAEAVKAIESFERGVIKDPDRVELHRAAAWGAACMWRNAAWRMVGVDDERVDRDFARLCAMYEGYGPPKTGHVLRR